MFFLFPRLEHPAGWICARYKSLLLLLLITAYTPLTKKDYQKQKQKCHRTNFEADLCTERGDFFFFFFFGGEGPYTYGSNFTDILPKG